MNVCVCDLVFIAVMSSNRKKSKDDDEWSDKRGRKKNTPVNEHCILHSSDVPYHGNVTSFKECKKPPTEKLAALHKIRDETLKGTS